ncbi:MAG TPA: hypothetical protein VJN18_02815 [Polyangiaceae bacterium]|nr:hypothetical protein [Polyangiaceae bacterium]
MKATRLLLSLLALASSACATKKLPPEPYRVELRASASDGAPLAGVELSINGKAAGTTGADGRLLRDVTGAEGTLIRVGAKCPAGSDPQSELPALRLARTKSISPSKSQALTAEVRCSPTHRDVVVVVKAERGSRLPVLIDGKPVATTDDDGTAHVMLRRAAGEGKVEVALDTAAQAGLKPVSPSRTYDLAGRDAVVLFEQSFSTTAPKVVKAAPVRRHIPIRVD